MYSILGCSQRRLWQIALDVDYPNNFYLVLIYADVLELRQSSCKDLQNHLSVFFKFAGNG